HWEVGGTTGSASFADLYDGQDLATVPVATDSELPVKIAYRFPYAETTGKHLGGTSQLLLYDVGLRLQGDYCGGIGPDPFTDAPIAPTDSASPSPSSSEAVSPDQQSASPGSGAGGSVTAAAGGRLPWTGANITFATISALFLIAAGITAAAGARARARRLSR
ncbi:MAG: hypothetical protein LBO75_03760, partial [Bifidobacteriaceae bacterium]|nr:hypothetical protein [Bifidobacteriaceae bacterium]